MHSMKYEKPLFQDFTLPGVMHVRAADAYAALCKRHAFLIDLREEEEYAEGIADVHDMVFFPLSSSRVWAFDTNPKVATVMCAHGIRSTRVCAWLAQKGVVGVLNLDGGFAQWKNEGLPICAK